MCRLARRLTLLALALDLLSCLPDPDDIRPVGTGANGTGGITTVGTGGSFGGGPAGAAGAGGMSPVVTHDAGGSSATGGATTAPPGTGGAGGTAPMPAPACNDLAYLDGARVAQVVLDYLPLPSGGSIVGGTYALTALRLYVPSPPKVPLTARGTLRISAGASGNSTIDDLFSVSDGATTGEYRRRSQATVGDDLDLYLRASCPASASDHFMYTASGNQLLLMKPANDDPDFGLVMVYTRR